MSSSRIIERTAIGSSGRVGSLYDGYRDCILDQVKVNTKETSFEVANFVKCELINGDTDKSRNLLQMIGIEAELRLSVLLSPRSRTGLAAVIDHPDPFNEYTRFLHCKYKNRYEELDTPIETPNMPESQNADVTPTHIITNVDWGIEVLIVLQLPSNAEKVTAIDDKLQKIRALLSGDQIDTKFCIDDEMLFENDVKTKVYSNILDLGNMTSVFNVCQYINGHSDRLNSDRPLKYLLKSIKCVYPQYEYEAPEIDFSLFRSPSIDELEQHLIRLLDKMKNLKYPFDCIRSGSLREHLKERLEEIQQEWIKLNKAYKEELNRIQKIIIQIRRQESDISVIDQILENYAQTILNQSIEAFIRNVKELDAKEKLINGLHEQHFEYCNAAALNVNKENYTQTLLDKFMTKQKKNRILCSNNTLNEKNQSKLNSSRDQLINEYGTNANLRLIYADFSYCSFSLPEIIILPTDKISDNPSMEKPSTSSSTKGEVNILLLGESGVGKSTFINAFIQYLAFKTLEEAESKEPIVLIPVSFLMTTGDDFEEKKINFGTVDNFNNEDFNHPGESVTQHCKSYVFALNKLDGQKLRIIDTPGFGDTRGIDQDDANMQHILKYINNLTHLNAICFLFKPNASRLNNFFPICLTQLLDLLGPDARQNIIFCFTNARPTFYTPGDTAPLLKAMLSNFSIGDIPFKKENTFCFDSESFRYLVALKNGINFDELDRKEYEMSWSTSLKESNRLVSYVTTELQTYSSHKQRQSAKNAQIQITQMIRPMLEAMRNILRHIVMTDMKILDKSVKLKPTAIHRPASRCASCNLITIQMGSFLLADDDPHEMLHHCHQCQCASSLHNSIDYILQYELLARSSDYDRNQMDRLVRQLHSTSSEFAYFLMHVARLMKSDPFLMGLTNIIIEEYNLCQVQKPNMLNSKLLEYLRNLQDKYEDNMDKMNGNEKAINMPSIYEQIQKIRAQPEVREQLNAVEESQQILMKEYEYVVPEHLFT